MRTTNTFQITIGAVIVATQVFSTACSGDSPVSKIEMGEVIELPLLPGDDPNAPFNHSTEPSIAVHGEHVVAAYINLGLDSATSYENTNLKRRVAIASSHDGGKTFGFAINPEVGDQTSDPVVRVNSNGDFFFSAVDPQPDVALAKSTDRGDTWTSIARFPGFDKEWMAISNEEQRVYIGSVAGHWAFDFEGQELASETETLLDLHIGAYADGAGVHFATGGGRGLAMSVIHWDGDSVPTRVGGSLPMGTSEEWANITASIGPMPGGGHWIVRSVETGEFRQVMLRVRNPPADEGVDIPLTEADRNAFMPAATTDDQGRLYVVWYETTDASTGVLKLMRSISDDWSKGFTEAIIVDADACPGNYWYPSSARPDADDRRLREYIDIAVTGTRAHVVWTHGNLPPARVNTVAVQFPE